MGRRTIYVSPARQELHDQAALLAGSLSSAIEEGLRLCEDVAVADDLAELALRIPLPPEVAQPLAALVSTSPVEILDSSGAPRGPGPAPAGDQPRECRWAHARAQ